MKRRQLSALTGLLMVMLLAIVPAASAQTQEPLIHTVQQGENLFRISLRYGVSMDAVMAANGLTDPHRLYAGQQLIIPGATASPPAAQQPATVGPHAYTVAAGDTISGIALRHNVATWALMQANGLTGPYIFAGQQLVIPAVGVAAAPPPPATGDTYTVQPGDTLSQIARRYGTTVMELARINGIANPSAIAAGQVLRLNASAVTPGLGSGKRILVDISEQHLYAYQHEQLVYSFVASTGAAPSYTRTGQFYVQSKIPNAYGSSWNIWMPHWLGIYWAGASENGIHALPILSNGQTLWAGYLGSPISYGCVVLGTQEAQLLYNWAELGTPVTIQP